MTLEPIRVGDLVEVDHHGRRFIAAVDEVLGGELLVDARKVNNGRATYRRVTARQVVGHWTKRRSRSSRGRGEVLRVGAGMEVPR